MVSEYFGLSALFCVASKTKIVGNFQSFKTLLFKIFFDNNFFGIFVFGPMDVCHLLLVKWPLDK